MQTVVLTILLYFGAFICLYIPYMLPDPRMWFFTILGMLLLTTPNILLWRRIYVSRTYKNIEICPKWKHLIEYNRRDNETVSIYGERAFPGESFLDVPGLGLIEFLGKDCFYTKGDKKYLMGLENISYSPDIRYSNLCHVLWKLGFRDTDDIREVLRGNDLLLMGKVYLAMEQYENGHGASKLVQDLKNYEGKTITFKKPVRPVWNTQTGVRRKPAPSDLHKEIDRVIN